MSVTADTDRRLRDRLLRFLLRERSAGKQDLLEIWSSPLEARVESGDAIDGLRYAGWDHEGTRVRFRVEENESRFRAGDRLRLGDGSEPESAPEVVYVDYEPESGLLTVELPRYGADRAAIERAVESTQPLVLDRGDVDLSNLLRDALDRVFGSEGERERLARDLLALRLAPTDDPETETAARASVARLAARHVHLNPAQVEAFARCWARRPFHLVQGPPGTGKTWLLALLTAALAWRGERILVTAQTHLAVDNVMTALARLAREMNHPLPLVRVSPKNPSRSGLEREGLRIVQGARRVPWPERGGLVVGATLYAAMPFQQSAPFDRVVFDEAAQIPLGHALCALLAGPRWLFFGDDQQLGPVIVGEHRDEETARSIFTHLRGATEPTLLDETYRMSDALCRFPSATFYGGRLRAAPPAAARRFAIGPGERFTEALDAPDGPVLVRIDHEGHRSACPPEARAAVDLAEELLVRRGLPASELAIISPFRMQNQEIQRALRVRLPAGSELPLVDTVERIQGQEREAVIVSLTCSDPDALRRDTSFFFSPNRLCVTLTRARTRLIVLGSSHLLRTLPRTHEGLCRVELFHRLFEELPTVDWSERYR
jgi:DNA replication ATP-dependent helicase Dna2